MSNTCTLQSPRRVMLRNKTFAVITHGVIGLAPFSLMGHLEADASAVQLWRRSGGWLEQPSRHELDIVGMFTPAGDCVAFPGIEIETHE